VEGKSPEPDCRRLGESSRFEAIIPLIVANLQGLARARDALDRLQSDLRAQGRLKDSAALLPLFDKLSRRFGYDEVEGL